MIEGKRLVRNGDYAVLELEEDDFPVYHYYIRTDNRWEKTENISDDVFADQNKMFCNLQQQCYSNGDSCDTLDHNKLDDNIITIKSMLNEFDNEYSNNVSSELCFVILDAQTVPRH